MTDPVFTIALLSTLVLLGLAYRRCGWPGAAVGAGVTLLVGLVAHLWRPREQRAAHPDAATALPARIRERGQAQAAALAREAEVVRVEAAAQREAVEDVGSPDALVEVMRARLDEQRGKS